MADLLIERLAGRTVGTGYDVRINLVMDTDTLLAAGTAPARLDGYGPIPADLARQIAGTSSETTIRRLFTAPTEQDLVRMKTTTRTYTGLLRELITIRDHTCRTQYCDAPIRHIDHAVPWSKGGRTTYANGQGLCENCNYTKEHPDAPHSTSPPPPLPGTERRSRVEDQFAKHIDIHLLANGPLLRM